MKPRNTVSVIVPAYNEENQIGVVLEILTKVDLVDEVIVVNDGSTDNTSATARRYSGVKVIERPQNGGKGAAMQTGIEASKGDIITFIDADLIGITQEHIEDLIQPLLEDGDLMMTVGKFTGGRFRTDLAQAIVPSISGQRAVRRTFFKDVQNLKDTGFGVEVAITRHAKSNKFKIKEVILPDASQVMKEEKHGFQEGFRVRMKMYADILKQYFRN